MNQEINNPDFANSDIEQRLWEYMDGVSSTSEKTVIEKLIASDAEWKNKYKELFEINSLLAAGELEEPSMRFTKNVMDEIGKLHIAPATKTYINKNIIRGIGIFFVTLITGFLIYGFGQMDWSAGSGDGNSKLPFDLSKIDLSKFFNNSYVTGFMMINIILGLVLLDSYFKKRREQWKKGESV
jgi:hypothetical protein